MSDEATGKSGKTWLYVMGMLIGLPLLYALSVGPAAVLFVRKHLPTESVAIIYMPLELFAKTTGTQDVFVSYVRAWCQLTGTPEP